MARDYQLVARFYRENPIVQIGFGAKISPQKISNQVKAVKKGDGPKKELIEALKHFNQFMTAQEFQQVTVIASLFFNYTFICSKASFFCSTSLALARIDELD